MYGGMNMATQSICHNIVIDDARRADSFVHALERAEKLSSHISRKVIPSRDLQKNEIKNFLGAVRKHG